MKIKFIGAAQEVTGSKHLITTDHGKKILLDCGMFQGKGLETDAANRNIMVDPKEIDATKQQEIMKWKSTLIFLEN